MVYSFEVLGDVIGCAYDEHAGSGAPAAPIQAGRQKAMQVTAHHEPHQH